MSIRRLAAFAARISIHRRPAGRGAALAVLALAAGGPIAHGEVYDVAPRTVDNAYRLRIADPDGIARDVQLVVELVSAPEWVRGTTLAVERTGDALFVRGRFDVAAVAPGARDVIAIRLRAADATGASAFDVRRLIHLRVVPTASAVQHSYRVTECCTPTVDVPDPHAVPAAIHLVGSTPNPASGSAAVVFGLPAGGGVVTLEIFDVRGRRLRRFDTPRLAGGYHQINWDLDDGAGRPIAPGTYFYRLRSGTWSETRKINVVR